MRISIKSILFTLPFSVLLTGCEYFLSFPTPPVDYSGQIDSVQDIDGNIYKTVGIGTQIWMTENLRTTRLNDGTVIPQIKNDSTWGYSYNPALCYYDNDSSKYWKSYGGLYNFFVINTDKLCPEGWHIPTSSDWNTLSWFLGGDKIAAGKLKEFYGPYWKDPNPCISNNFGFSALPGGNRRNLIGKFSGLGITGYYWIDDAKNIFSAPFVTMSYSNTYLGRGERSWKYGYSVRCIKD